ncbi:hypothetical protein AA11826_0837 [Komagataeibacter oboediens DSM 11826]|nr:hypothetical protein AA11826_0837 [Komagataeibacter oboediens DSM 11826]
MPSVCDLNGRWCASVTGIRVGSSPVSGNDLNTGILHKPCSKGIRLPVW